MKKVYSILSILLTIALIGTLVSCEKDQEVMLTAVSVTNEQITPMYNSATISSTISSEATIREVFVQYARTKDFAEYDEVSMQEIDGRYTAELLDLQDNTIYYYRYAASNRHSAIVLKTIHQFETLEPTVPTISLDTILTVWDSYAQVQISLSFDGGANVSEMGVCWGTNPEPTPEDNVLQTKDTVAVLNISSLEPNTQYYVRAYATNKIGVGYSQTYTFTTFAMPQVQSNDITDIQLTSAMLNGLLVSDGNDTAVVVGFCWSENAEPTISDILQIVEIKDNIFNYYLSNLKDETQYFVRAFAQNRIGVAYGEVKAFTTASTVIPTVLTTAATQVTTNSAVVGGNVTDDGGAEVTERGIVYATTPNPTTANSKLTSGSGVGVFTCDLTDLQSNATYYARAYAINKKGVAYGEEVSFTTNKNIVLPSITTNVITQITETSAVAGGNVTSDGNASVTERGVVYSTNPNPVITNLYNTIKPCGSGTGSFTCDLTNLQPNTTYYLRAYATNSIGTAYGEEVSFTTKEDETVVSDPTGTENGYGYVDLGLSVKWAIMNVGAESPEEYGDYFAWGETEPKSIYDWSTYKYCNGSNLTLTKYNTNSSYGIVDNKTQLELSDDAAYMNWGGAWRMPTDAEMTELREQCTWKWTSQNGMNGYRVTSNSNGNSIFLPAAGYRYESSLRYAGSEGDYWSSSLDTDYSNVWFVLFSSDYVYRRRTDRCWGKSVRPVLRESEEEVTDPTVTTAAITQITETSAVAGGNVTSDGNASVTERGVVYSTNPNPVITNLYNTIKPCGSGTGSFTCDLTNLQPNTTYYVRAYATNSMGTAYGEEVSFTTNKNIVLPSLITNIITQITETTAVAGGNVTSDGNASVTERGVVYSTNPNPVITNLYNTIKPCGSGTGSFTCDLTNLQPNTTYYVRAYATNSMGTAYGEEVSFTTNKNIVLPSLITNIITQITETTAVAGGNVTSDGNASVTERGVVYSTNPNPVITNLYNTIKPCGSGAGSFTCDLTNLQPNTTYYVRAYATNSMGTAYGEEVSFTTEEEVVAIPEYVDLGLSVKWATFNVGATKPEEFGDYFAWGEVEPKSEYSWATYKYCQGAYNALTKYCSNSNYGFIDGKNILESMDDAATINLGSTWRIPTKEEWKELQNPINCTWTWQKVNNVNGYRVTSIINGNSIFLPAAGTMVERDVSGQNSAGYYWSANIDDFDDSAWILLFNASVTGPDNDRNMGHSIRAVFGVMPETTLASITTNAITQITATSAVAGGNVTSDGNASVTERGIVYSTNPNPVITNLYNTIKPCGSGTGSFICDLTNLQPNTTYYVRAYASNSMGTAYGEEVSFTTQEQVSPPFDDTENGYGYVDLGLSVKWATCNVGANTPEEYGDYFAWGETEPKETYDDDNYKWFTSGLGYTKYYNGTVGIGILDNRKTMEPSDDAATVNWGGNWRVPTREELTELETNCTWTLTTQSGISGYRVTSKKAGYTNKSIFIPLAGKSRYYKEYVGELALYWSSSLYLYECSSAFVLFNDECINTDMNRYNGLTIRPVYGPRVEEVIALPTVITHAVTALESDYALIMYEILDDGGSNITDAGVVYSLSTNPTILDNKVSYEKHPDDKYDCDLYDLQPNTTYYVRAYATNEMGTAYGEEISFTTKEESNTPSNGTENGYAYVDLGLSVKWATCNVGASSPEEYGDYFAWGEIEPKEVYDWSTYKYCNGSKTTLTKYCTDSYYGTVDNKTTLELSDDAARANWGGSWRMPTKAEQDELRNNCTWTWTTQNGVYGYYVTSKKNDNSIFLPAAGRRLDSSLDYAGSNGYYWSSSLDTPYSYYACYLDFYSSNVDWYYNNRNCGFSVRPVYQ